MIDLRAKQETQVELACRTTHGRTIPDVPLMHVKSGNFTWVALGALAIVSAITCFFVFDDRPAIGFAIIIMLGPVAVAAHRFRNQGLLDPLGLYCSAFAAYNGIVLLRLASMEDPTATVYPWTFNQEVYGEAGFLISIAAITIYVTATLARHVVPSPPRISSGKDESAAGWFPAGITMYCAGIAMYFLQYAQIGGYLAGIKAGRGNRFAEFQTAGLSWPYGAFVFPGLAAIWYASFYSESKAKKIVGWVALLLWCALVIPQGDRFLPVQAVITVTAVWTICRHKRLKVTLKLVTLLAVAYVALAAFGYLRKVIAPYVSGEMTEAETQYVVENESLFDTLKPERSELAGPFLSILEITSVPSQYLLEGNSYADASMSILPKALYPGTKPSYLSERFAASVHRGKAAVSGWGFNPVAEAYLNFGVMGIAPIFVLWTLAFYGLSLLREYRPVGALIYSVLVTETVDANRMDFRNVYSIAIYCTAGVLVTYVMAMSFSNLGARLSPLSGLTWRAHMPGSVRQAGGL